MITKTTFCWWVWPPPAASAPSSAPRPPPPILPPQQPPLRPSPHSFHPAFLLLLLPHSHDAAAAAAAGAAAAAALTRSRSSGWPRSPVKSSAAMLRSSESALSRTRRAMAATAPGVSTCGSHGRKRIRIRTRTGARMGKNDRGWQCGPHGRVVRWRLDGESGRERRTKGWASGLARRRFAPALKRHPWPRTALKSP